MPITRTLATLATLLAAFAGAFALSVPATAQAPVSECNDGKDNNGDGKADGADPNCQSESGSAYGGIVTTQKTVAVPVVTLQGTVSGRGVVDVKKLEIQGFRGTQVRIVCRGKRCPAKSQTVDLLRQSVRLKRFERKLRPDMQLVIKAGRKGDLGRLTRYTIKRGQPPVRLDTCFDGQTMLVRGCFES